MDTTSYKPVPIERSYDVCQYQDEIELVPAKLVKALGQPEYVNERVTGQYTFEGPDGKIWTLYEYKSTDEYEDELFAPSVFWSWNYGLDFHIGGEDREGIENFAQWLRGIAE